MVWGLFKSGGAASSPQLEEHMEPVNFKDMAQPAAEEKTGPTLSIKDLAEGKTRRRWCSDCHKEFQEVAFRGRRILGCRNCWRKKDFQGLPPQNAAPHGHMAATGMWEDPNILKLRLRRNSTGGVASWPPSQGEARPKPLGQPRLPTPPQPPEPAETPEPGQPLQRRGSNTSMASVRSMESAPAGQDGAAVNPRRASVPVMEDGQLSWLAPNPRAMDFGALERFARSSNIRSSGRKTTKELVEELRSATTYSRSSPKGGEGRSSRPGTAGSAPRRSLRKDSVQGSDAGDQAPGSPARPSSRAGARDKEGASRSKDSTPSLPLVKLLNRRSSADLVFAAEEARGPLRRDRALSVPSIADNPRAISIIKKLSQTRMVQDAVVALVTDLARSKLTSRDLFDRLDLNGDGQLTKLEMQQGIRKLGITLPPIELDAVIRAFDSDGNGTVDPEEFTETLDYWMPVVRPILEAEEAAAREASGLTVTRELLAGGLEAGMRVRSLAKLPGQASRKEEGEVMGPGLAPGTVKVRFKSSGETLSLKPSLVRAVPKAA